MHLNCVHALDGRIRIKVPCVKDSEPMAAHVERFLDRWDGIQSVKANPHTGNVLIHYHPRQISQGIIAKLLREQGYLPEPHRAAHQRSAPRPNLGAKVAENVFITATEIALRSLIGALV